MKPKPLFVLLVKGFAGFYVPLSLFFGLGSLLNLVPATLNEQSYYGIQGLAIYVLFSPLVVLLLAVSTWIIVAPGLFIQRLVSKLVTGTREQL